MQEERPRVTKRLGKRWGWESERWETRGAGGAAESRCGNGAGVPVRPGLFPVALDPSHLPERVKQARGW